MNKCREEHHDWQLEAYANGDVEMRCNHCPAVKKNKYAIEGYIHELEKKSTGLKEALKIVSNDLIEKIKELEDA